MKLLFCIKAMNNPGGGAERVLAEVVNGLVARHHEVALLTFETPGGQSFYPLDARVQRIDLGVGSTVRPATVQETGQRIVALRRQVLANAPEVAIGFMHSMFIPLGLALLPTSVPVIASEHIVPAHYRSRRPIESLLLAITPLLVKRITCVSEQVRLAYPRYLHRRMVAIANPIQVEVASLADVRGQPGLPKTLLAVGRLEAQKDHQTLIRAFWQIANELPDWNLRIVGEGSLRQALEAEIEGLGLGDRVQLAGSTPDIAAEYQAAQLFVIPSRYESFGLTTAEALAHGLPVVGFEDCQGTNQLVKPGLNGDLAAGAGDRVASLATALKKIMSDEKLRHYLSKNSAFGLGENDLNHVLDQWEALITDVVQTK